MSTKKPDRWLESQLIGKVPPVGAVDSKGLRTKQHSAYKLEAYGSISTSTAFGDRAMRGYGDDYFNGWQMEFIGNNLNTSNLAVGELTNVTDYVDKTGVFTVAGFSGTILVGDEFILRLPEGERVVTATSSSALTSGDIFTIDGGEIKVIELRGIITTDIQAQATTTKLTYTSDRSGATTTDLCATADLDAKTDGTMLRVTGDFSEALVVGPDGDGLIEGDTVDMNGVIMEAGDITTAFGAASTGAIKWTIVYVSRGGRVTTS